MRNKITAVYTDDEAQIRELAEIAIPMSLPSWEVTVHLGSSKEDLVRLVKEHNPEIIITDKDMPKENAGLEALKEIRALGYATPAILTSGRELPLDHGISDLSYLPKPWTIDQFSNLVRKTYSRFSA